MKTYGVADAWIHIFLTSALVGGAWSASHHGRFMPGERAPWQPLDRRLGRPQSWYEWYGQVTIFDPTGT
jgi:hypothetical protein